MSYEDNKLARVGLSTVTSWSNQLRYPNTKSDLRSYLSSKCNLSFFRIYKCPLVSLGNFTSSEHRSFLVTGKVPSCLYLGLRLAKIHHVSYRTILLLLTRIALSSAPHRVFLIHKLLKLYLVWWLFINSCDVCHPHCLNTKQLSEVYPHSAGVWVSG